VGRTLKPTAEEAASRAAMAQRIENAVAKGMGKKPAREVPKPKPPELPEWKKKKLRDGLKLPRPPKVKKD